MYSRETQKGEAIIEEEEDREERRIKQELANEKSNPSNQETETEGSQVPCAPMRSKGM
jgi:hypothetical protein